MAETAEDKRQETQANDTSGAGEGASAEARKASVEALEAKINELSEKLSDVTSESIKRKEKIRALEEDLLVRKRQAEELENAEEEQRRQQELSSLSTTEQIDKKLELLQQKFLEALSASNKRIEEMVGKVEEKDKERVEQMKQAALSRAVSRHSFHDEEVVRKLVDLSDVPIVNGEPDQREIEKRVEAIVKERPFLVKETKAIPDWGGTNPPPSDLIPGVPPGTGTQSAEEIGKQVLDRLFSGDVEGTATDVILNAAGKGHLFNRLYRRARGDKEE